MRMAVETLKIFECVYSGSHLSAYEVRRDVDEMPENRRRPSRFSYFDVANSAIEVMPGEDRNHPEQGETPGKSDEK